MDIHIHVSGDLVVQAQPVEAGEILDRLDSIEAKLGQIGATVSQLDDVVDQIVDLVASQAATIADLSGQLVTALGNDAADAATIQAKQEELDALNADVNENVAQLQAALPGDGPAPGNGNVDPVPPGHGEPPPTEPAPGDSEPGAGGVPIGAPGEDPAVDDGTGGDA